VNESVFRTAKEQEIYEGALDFARRAILPVAAEIDQDQEVPEALVRAAAAEGYFGRILPEEYGGLGGTIGELCAQQEGLGYGSMAAASVVMASSICGWPILQFGSDEQKAHFLPRLARGEVVGTIAITEPSHGSDAAHLDTRAERTDDGGWLLDGQKWLIDNVQYADFFLCYARTRPLSDDEPAYRGLSTFLVERDREGWREAEIYDLLGLRGLGVGGFHLDGVRLPPENLIGLEGRGFYQLMAMLGFGRAATSSLIVGGMQAALDAGKAYAAARRQFGVPLIDHQAIAFKVADMATKVDACRLLVLRAARMLDAGERADREVSMAQWFAAEMGMEVAHQALQIHGGVGCTKKAAVERIYRDMRIFSIGEGTTEMQKTVIARREMASVPELEIPLPEKVWAGVAAGQLAGTR
jgi:butyryl-CoA dehydrogenase